MIVTDNVGGMESNKKFYDQVMHMGKKYPEAVYPNYFILMSWYDHPKYVVRKVCPNEEYTMTRTVLDFFNAISNRIGDNLFTRAEFASPKVSAALATNPKQVDTGTK